MSRVRQFCFVALCCLTGSATALEDQGLYMHVLDVSTRALSADESPSVRLFVDKPEQVAAALDRFGLSVTSFDDQSVTLSPDTGHLTTIGDPAKAIDETFIVDFSEASVQAMLAEQAWFGGSEPPTLASLSKSVYDWIDDKTYGRGFDFASKTARTRSGDCTEHALLLAAITRATGRPARVIFGVLLIDAEQPVAFGHAWTEVWEQDQWQVLDATEPQREVASDQLQYIPLGVVDNESPSYGMTLMNLTLRFPARVEWAK